MEGDEDLKGIDEVEGKEMKGKGDGEGATC